MFNSKLSLKDIATINHIQKEILKSINQWHKIYYVPPFLDDEDPVDGIRFHDKEDIIKIDVMIRNYLDLENIEYTDLTNIPIDERDQWVINDLLKSRK